MAHEINQPLSRVVLTSQLALEEAGELAKRDPRLFPFLKELASEANRVVVTIDQMKSLLRNVETIHAPLDLVDVVEDALLYGKPLLKAHEVQISFRRPAGDFGIDGDAGQLQIAIGNLLRNAAEAISQAPATAPDSMKPKPPASCSIPPNPTDRASGSTSFTRPWKTTTVTSRSGAPRSAAQNFEWCFQSKPRRNRKHDWVELDELPCPWCGSTPREKVGRGGSPSGPKIQARSGVWIPWRLRREDGTAAAIHPYLGFSNGAAAPWRFGEAWQRDDAILMKGRL